MIKRTTDYLAAPVAQLLEELSQGEDVEWDMGVLTEALQHNGHTISEHFLVIWLKNTSNGVTYESRVSIMFAKAEKDLVLEEVRRGWDELMIRRMEHTA